jgi:hypothetical protein
MGIEDFADHESETAPNAHDVAAILSRSFDPATWAPERLRAIKAYVKGLRPKTDVDKKAKADWLEFLNAYKPGQR